MYRFLPKSWLTLMGLLVASSVLVACAAAGTVHSEQHQAARVLPPVAIGPTDRCHVCNMVIKKYPGPKGEAYVGGHDKPYKFCSTHDLFIWLLRPENKDRATAVYVHDMGATSWAHPSDKAFINARTAWYVIDQPLQGAMGATLASFARRADAEAFIKAHGGKLVGFSDLTLKLIKHLGGGGKMDMKKMDMKNMKMKKMNMDK